MKWIIILVGFLSFVLIPFIFFGDYFNNFFTELGAIQWIQSFEKWGWIFGILLLVGDIFLPLPGTIIMAALGYVYGPFLGGIFAFLGSFLSGVSAYFLCRTFGIGWAKRIIGENDYLKGQQLFYNQGGWLVALSRWLPILSEVSACMAGLTKMPKSVFFTALACGALPMGFLFAFLGSIDKEISGLAISINLIVPAFLWFIASLFLRKKKLGN